MCGIVGITFRGNAGASGVGLEKLRACFTAMLLKAQVRGSAATGIAVIHGGTGANATVLRAPLAAEDFVKDRQYIKVINEAFDEDTISIIGHTRAVSGGASALLNNNNHPFVCGSFIGVHNGFISNNKEIREACEPEMPSEGTCDSEVIFSLAHLLYDQTKDDPCAAASLSRALETVVGWFAVAAVSMEEPHKFLLARDTASPLSFAWCQQNEIGFVASEQHYTYDSVVKVGLPTNLVAYSVPEDIVLCIDSTIPRGNEEFHCSGVRIVAAAAVDKSKLIEENEEAYAITQGKRG